LDFYDEYVSKAIEYYKSDNRLIRINGEQKKP